MNTSQFWSYCRQLRKLAEARGSGKTRTALPFRNRGKRPSAMGETAIKMANDLIRVLSTNRKFRGVHREKNWMGSNKYSDTQVVTIKGDVSKWGAELQDLIAVVEGLGYQVTETRRDSFRAVRDPKHIVRGSFFPSYGRETISFTLEVYAPKKAAPSMLPYYD